MNVVLEDVEEIWVKDTKTKKAGDRNTLGAHFASLLSLALSNGTDRERQWHTGRLLLKGENITLIQAKKD